MKKAQLDAIRAYDKARIDYAETKPLTNELWKEFALRRDELHIACPMPEEKDLPFASWRTEYESWMRYVTPGKDEEYYEETVRVANMEKWEVHCLRCWSMGRELMDEVGWRK